MVPVKFAFNAIWFMLMLICRRTFRISKQSGEGRSFGCFSASTILTYASLVRPVFRIFFIRLSISFSVRLTRNRWFLVRFSMFLLSGVIKGLGYSNKLSLDIQRRCLRSLYHGLNLVLLPPTFFMFFQEVRILFFILSISLSISVRTMSADLSTEAEYDGRVIVRCFLFWIA